MKRLKSAFSFLIGLAILVLLAWGAIRLVGSVVGFLTRLDSELATAFVAASAAVVASLVASAVTKAYETRSAVLKDLREKKTPVYEGIVHTLFDMMFAPILGKKRLTEDDLKQFLAETTEKLTVWGSDDVLKEFSEFRSKRGVLQNNPSEALFLFEKLLLAIRRDLGHRNRGLKQGSILRLFIVDLDKIMDNTP